MGMQQMGQVCSDEIQKIFQTEDKKKDFGQDISIKKDIRIKRTFA